MLEGSFIHWHHIENKGILEAMPIAEREVQDARRELERVLASAIFLRNERHSRLLRFVVEEHLEGRDNALKESVIAVEVFGRTTDHDPKLDSIVRTEASRLRARLREYFAGEGKSDELFIELPKGGYTPVFRRLETTLQPDQVEGKTRSKFWFAIALAGFAAGLATAGWWLFIRKSTPISIAVLPLENLGHEPANDYFADGLTDELIRNLSVIEGLEVRSRTSSFAWKGKSRDVQEAGMQLRAEYILEGSVMRDRQQLRINAQLVRVRDDFPLWSGRYDKELADAVVIQDEISRGIVNGLRLKLGRGRRRYEVNAEAYDLYLRARSLELRRGFVGLSNSVDAFGQVIAKDPSFAPAYAGLAAAHAARSGQFRYNFGDEITRMRTAAEKAIELDPLLPEAHAALGMAFARDGQWEMSEKSFRHAIALDPNRSESHRDFASFFFAPLGRGAEAIVQLRLAEKADPLAPDVHNLLSARLISAGRYDEAAQHCDKLPVNYWGKNECLGNVRLQQGRTDDALRILEAAFYRGVWKGSELRGALGDAYVRAGRRDDAEKLAAASPFNPFNQARIYAALGDKDRTFEALDGASVAGPFRIGRALTSPYYALLKGDPRLKALRKKAGLPE